MSPRPVGIDSRAFFYPAIGNRNLWDSKPKAALSETGTERDREYIEKALQLAWKGVGHTHPNPMVGSLIVRRNKVLGSGWHRRLGGPHAEIYALRQAGLQARGATLFVTLEPCSHHGRTPPCVDAIKEARIKRVVVAAKDPNPLVSGKGIRALRRAGIQVVVGVCQSRAQDINIGYFKVHSTGLPWITLKLASSLDGKLAPASRRGWLTGQHAVRAAHQLRAHHDAVLVGGGTARTDDPRLTVRAARGDDPLRVVASASLNLPLKGKLFRNPLVGGTIIGTVRPRTGIAEWEKRRERLRARGAQVWVLPGRGNRVPLESLLRRLGKEGAYHVLAEGGAELAGSLLAARLPDEMQLFVAPLVLGEGVGWAAGACFETGRAPHLTNSRVEAVGQDWLVTGRLEYGVHRNRGRVGSRP